MGQVGRSRGRYADRARDLVLQAVSFTAERATAKAPRQVLPFATDSGDSRRLLIPIGIFAPRPEKQDKRLKAELISEYHCTPCA